MYICTHKYVCIYIYVYIYIYVVKYSYMPYIMWCALYVYPHVIHVYIYI